MPPSLSPDDVFRIGRDPDPPPGPLPIVLVTAHMGVDVLAPLAGVARVILAPEGVNLLPRAEVMKRAGGIAGVINHAELRVDREFLDAAPLLKIVANASIGVDNLDLPLMRGRGVWATNTPDSYVEATADSTIGFLLCVARRLAEADGFVRIGAWREFQPGSWDGVLLGGKTLGIVGYGRIGHAVERRARAFGMRVIHYRRSPGAASDGYTPLDSLLSQSDFVSVHTPLNADSDRLFTAERLRQMKRGAFLINVSRGRVVDEKALVLALKSGHLAGAALDVFEEEPKVHPELIAMPQVVLSPHLGGATVESRFDSRRLCAENVAQVLKGERPVSPVD